MEPTPSDRAQRFPCQFCAEGHEGDAGGSYDRAHCEERDILRRLAALRPEQDGVGEEIRRLERRLEQVRYVGD